MKIDFDRLELAEAKSGKTHSEINKEMGMSSGYAFIRASVKKGFNITPRTVGRVARALNCSPEDLIAKSE